jgi:type VI secretion system secreted protein VgrG
MATIPSQALRHLQIQTNLGSNVFIPLQVQYSEALGQPFQAQVTLACHATDVDFDDILGTNATIAIHNAATAKKGSFGYTRYINGFFSSIAFHGHGAEGEALFQATIVPWIWFLTRTSDCRIFQNKTVPDILEEVFRDAGFSDFRKDLHGDYKPREFCVQYRETDFQFVMRLMECEGIYYYFEHDNGSHMMVLCDDMVCHKKDDQHEVIRYIGGAEAMDRKGCINEWSFSKQVKPGRVALNDFNFKTPVPDPNLRLLARSTAPEAQKPDTYEIYDSFGGYGDVSEGNRYARIRMEQAISDRETAHGSTDIVGLRAGGKFTLDRHPIESQNREYLLTRVEFMAREATYGSGSGGGGQFFTSSFTCIPMEVTFRPHRTTPLPRIEGPQTATVCGPKGQEIYVDEHARVKVQFHWDRYGKADAGSSCWIRVSQPWAGAGFGGMAIPRIGHEVIVEFIEADPDRPIITGRVYNEAHKSPYALPDHATKTTIKSNSSPGSQGFNELRFEDKKGKEQVFIHSQKNFDLRVKNQIRETNHGERHEKIGESHYVTVAKEENTLIEDKHYEMTKENHLTVQGDLLEKVESNLKTYAGDANVINAKDLLVETSTSISLKTNLCKIQGAMGVHVRGQQINVEGTSLCLKSGSSFISITPAGIFIQATMVMINSGGASSPAQEPAAAPEISVMEPLDALAAAVANPGKMVGVGGGTAKVRTRGGGPVKLHNAPNYTPPPEAPLPIPIPIPPPGPPESKKPCGIKEMTVSCGHSASRKVKSGGTIIVVPTPSLVVSAVVKYGEGEVSIEFVVTSKTGGADSVTIDVDTIEGGKGQSQISETPTGGSGGSWGAGAARVHGGLKNDPNRKWTLNTEPKATYIYGKGCDDVIHQVTVKTLPPDNHEYVAKVEGFRKFIEEINEYLEETFSVDFGPATITPILVPPSGELKLSYGWSEEETADKAVFKLSGSASLSMGAGVKVEVSLAQIAYAGLLSSIGVPPPISTELAEIAGDYIADILVGVEVTANPKFTGELFSKWYYPGGGDVGGRFALGVEGKVKAYMTGKVGNGKIAGVSIKGSAETGIFPSGGIEVSTAGVLLDCSLKCNGLELTVSIVFETFAFDWEEGFKWKPIDDFDIWKPAPLKLISFE